MGKTSLISRFVKGIFSEKYLTTVGVKIDRKTVEVEDQEVLMMVWDLAGEEEFDRLRSAYLRGASGIIYVVDGTRGESLDHALGHIAEIENQFPNIPSLLLINKSDLEEQWDLDREKLDSIPSRIQTLKTSAKSGQNVELAFSKLARKLTQDS